MGTRLSVLIPAANEMFLPQTVEDLLKHTGEETEIIAVLDGTWMEIPQHERLNVIYLAEPIGQRAATNLAARLARGKYVAKVDAHCSFDENFDVKMLKFFEEHGDGITAVPVMRNLWAYDWKCYSCGWKKYQGPTPKKCPDCGGQKIKRKMMWVGKRNPQSTSYCFDSEPHFQYFNEFKNRPEYNKGGYNETMSLQGSFFMCTLENFWKWEVNDETLGNWGNQGIEVACATWLSGGRCLCNHNTWYAHMFRTQGGDFSFPWDVRGRAVEQTKQNVKDKFWNMKHPTQIHPVSWLIEKFAPVPGWTNDDLTKIKV